MRILFKYLKRFILGGFLLYAYNLIAVTYNITIPINLFTIFIVGLLDIPGLAALVILKLVGL
ncbi:MAG: pro-sigmaK processing inhibitor BofA family protein [Bacilli bacterium]|nr:pro-sigmaK processing inhibitor BofA family protein [Bacilli bacterium]